jgi:DNA-binding transcriptional ArsR family regulator
MVSTAIRATEKVLKALASRRRLAILVLLRERGALPVMNVAGGIGLSFPATSRHLRILASAELVETEQRGLLVYYKLPANLPTVPRSTLASL